MVDRKFQKRWGEAPRAGGKHKEPEGIMDISEEDDWEAVRRSVNRDESPAGSEKTDFVGLDQFPEDAELTITSVQMMKRPKYRYRIIFGTLSLEVHEDVMIKYRMIKGAVFTRNELEEVVLADERQRCYADALQYLSRKPRTAYEMTIRLGEKGWSDEHAAEAVRRLTDEGLLNDAAYAQEWASQRVRGRGKGKLWVRQELRQKGVSKPLIEEALDTVSEDEEYESAKELAAKKWRTTTGETVDRKRKTGTFLLRRGYQGALVSKVIRELAQQDGMRDEDDWEDQ